MSPLFAVGGGYSERDPIDLTAEEHQDLNGEVIYMEKLLRRENKGILLSSSI